jgi:hypothetical protein
MLEIFGDRVNAGSSLIPSQLPVDTWHIACLARRSA